MGTSGNTKAAGYGSLDAPFTADTFKSMSPAYGFQLQQGAQGTLNQDSGSQGAESGAALKDLQSYNQNFANTSFNNAFNQYQTQQNNVFGRLNSLATLGQGAASNQATGASSFANSIGNSATNVGSSLAAGQIGSANAAAGAANNLGSLGSAYGWLNQSNSNSLNNQFQNSGSLSSDFYTGSDWFLKKNVEPYLFYGMVPLYKFHYRTQDDSDRKHIGVIAQEIVGLRPDTVKRDTDGYLKVNYRKLGIPTDADWAALEAQANG